MEYRKLEQLSAFSRTLSYKSFQGPGHSGFGYGMLLLNLVNVARFRPLSLGLSISQMVPICVQGFNCEIIYKGNVRTYHIFLQVRIMNMYGARCSESRVICVAKNEIIRFTSDI
jgi:hypothetical protein